MIVVSTGPNTRFLLKEVFGWLLPIPARAHEAGPGQTAAVHTGSCVKMGGGGFETRIYDLSSAKFMKSACNML